MTLVYTHLRPLLPPGVIVPGSWDENKDKGPHLFLGGWDHKASSKKENYYALTKVNEHIMPPCQLKGNNLVKCWK